MKEFYVKLSLVKVLMYKEILLKKVDTKLGLFWSILIPLLPMSAYILLSYLEFFKRSTDIPYVMYITIGMTIFMLINTFIKTCITFLKTNQALLKNYTYSMNIWLFIKNTTTFLEFLIRLVVVTGVLIFYGISPSVSWFFLPLVFVIIFMFSYSLGMILSFWNLLYNDISKGVTLFLRYGIFISSVIFPFPTEGTIGFVGMFNPFNTFVVVTRDLIVGKIDSISSDTFLITSALSIILFYSVIRFYSKNEYELKKAF